MWRCRTQVSPKMQVQCTGCAHQTRVPHSCGFSPLRAWPAPQEPAMAGTAPQAAGAGRVFPGHLHLAGGNAIAGLGESGNGLRPAAALRLGNPAHLQTERQATAGHPGAIAVLHTNTRGLEYHPHAHFAVPAAALDAERKQWRAKRCKKGQDGAGGALGYLFKHTAMATVFRAKMLTALDAQLPRHGERPQQERRWNDRVHGPMPPAASRR